MAFRETGFEGRNIKEDDTDGHMLADDPIPASPIAVPEEVKATPEEAVLDEKVTESKSLEEAVEEKTKPEEEIKIENTSTVEELSKDSNESGPQEEPKALPVQAEDVKANETLEKEN